MSDLLWPGDHRAAGTADDAAFLDAVLAVEAAWSQVLAASGIAPVGAAVSIDDLRAAAAEVDRERLAGEAEADGNVVVPLLRALRQGLPEGAGRWLHRGLTSQDVVDTALLLMARDAVARIRADLRTQTALLADLVRQHRSSPAVARTLTQHAVPTVLGLRMAGWLAGVLDAHDDLAALRWPVQAGGAAGTMAAAVELAGHRPAPEQTVQDAVAGLAERLGLETAAPWHVVRTPLTRLGDALVRCSDAWGHLAGDVLTLSRSEVGELSEGRAGASSTMPHKKNPVLATLVRRTALTSPALGATLHLAAAEAVDERPAGPWHAEWDTLRLLLRRTVVAGSQVTDLLRDLVIDADRAAENLAVAHGVRAEQDRMAALAERGPLTSNRGTTDAQVDQQLARADALLAEAT
ncbi:MAG: lyase family protein [Motilibacteraceae bacterium]